MELRNNRLRINQRTWEWRHGDIFPVQLYQYSSAVYSRTYVQRRPCVHQMAAWHDFCDALGSADSGSWTAPIDTEEKRIGAECRENIVAWMQRISWHPSTPHAYMHRKLLWSCWISTTTISSSTWGAGMVDSCEERVTSFLVCLVWGLKSIPCMWNERDRHRMMIRKLRQWRIWKFDRVMC